MRAPLSFKHNINFEITPQLVNLERDGLVYLDTKNPVILEKYLELRRKVFGASPMTCRMLKPNQGWEYDLDTHVLAVMDGDRCIGGAIIIINDSIPGKFLPLENKDVFQLKKLYPEFDLEHNAYAEFNYFVVDKDHRDWTCSANLFRMIYNLCVTRGVKILFGTAAAVPARRNRIALQRLNMGLEAVIRDDIHVLPFREEWNGYERQLIVVDIRSKYFSDLPLMPAVGSLMETVVLEVIQ